MSKRDDTSSGMPENWEMPPEDYVPKTLTQLLQEGKLTSPGARTLALLDAELRQLDSGDSDTPH